MSAVLSSLPHRKFSVEEYHRFIEIGIFKPDERLELWEGEFVETPIGKRHAGIVAGLTAYLNHLFFQKLIVWTQNPIVLNDFSEPQPDIVLLKRREDFYTKEHAGPADVLLIIEVADSSLDFDRSIKAPLYAEARIREYWLADIPNNCLWVYSGIEDDEYSNIRRLNPDAALSPEVRSLAGLNTMEVLFEGVGELVKVVAVEAATGTANAVDGAGRARVVSLAVRPDVRVVQRPPRGKGDALRAGFAAASSGDVPRMEKALNAKGAAPICSGSGVGSPLSSAGSVGSAGAAVSPGVGCQMPVFISPSRDASSAQVRNSGLPAISRSCSSAAKAASASSSFPSIVSAPAR